MKLLVLILAILSHYPALVEARQYRGEVIAVADGDTLTMKARNNRRMTIRLADIDAPEKRQPYGMKAKQSLTELAQGKAIIVDKRTIDKYRRTVGTVYRYDDALNLNREMVRRGDGWAYIAYLQDLTIMALQEAAEQRKDGLWSLPPSERIPPWKWRKNRR